MPQNSSSNTVWHSATVTRERRAAQNGHRSAVVWFTGLSGSGKSTLAHAVEEELHQAREVLMNEEVVGHDRATGVGTFLPQLTTKSAAVKLGLPISTANCTGA